MDTFLAGKLEKGAFVGFGCPGDAMTEISRFFKQSTSASSRTPYMRFWARK
jgi:hypothetical protein